MYPSRSFLPSKVFEKVNHMECQGLKGIDSLENVASMVKLDLYDMPYLNMISNFPSLRKLESGLCPNLDSLVEMNALRRLVLRVFKTEKQLRW
jgi:hypothetical protein